MNELKGKHLIAAKMHYLGLLKGLGADSVTKEDRDKINGRIAAVCDDIEKSLGICAEGAGSQNSNGVGQEGYTFEELYESQRLDWNDCQMIARALGDRLSLVIKTDLNLGREITPDDTRYRDKIKKLELMFSALAGIKKK